MSQKDYYLLLGVLPNAEDVVIKAAYRALIQRYHPDRYNGSAEEAKRRTIELNEAYEVLSDPNKRADYDRIRKSSQGSTSDYDYDDDSESYSAGSELDEDWQFALQYYPDLVQLETRLRRISISLSIGFRQAILTTKEFTLRQDVAKILEQSFLENYFGTNPKIIEFALKLIFDGKKSGAKELNKTVSILGSGLDADLVIAKLTAKHYAEEIAAKEEEARKKRERERLEREAREKAEREAGRFLPFYILILSVIVFWAVV
jgi:curved DNA-binding protein CbpA